jgi:hypothetical protein
MSEAEQQVQDQESQREHDQQRRIRERAYFIWEEEGRPEGRHRKHWERARVQIDQEDGTGPWSERGC